MTDMKDEMLSVTPDISEFERCPGCNEPLPLTDLDGKPNMPPSSLWVLEDDNIPCKWLIINGWICGNSVYGTVVMRGPDTANGEREPVKTVLHGNSYVIGLTGRRMFPTRITDY